MSTNDRRGGQGGDDASPDSSPPSSRMPSSSRHATLPPSSRRSIPPPGLGSSPPSNRHSIPPGSSPPSTLSSMQKAIVALDRVKARLDAVERQKTEPIAILGMACRFPGDASTPEAFFRFLQAGGDAVTQVPAERWQLDASSATDGDADRERRATRWGAFLRVPVDRFDARFFGISPREAAHLDPQQRLLLEMTWEALERSGQDPAALVGSQTGVFVGISTNDYLELCRASGPDGADVYAATGNGQAFASGRLSYTFGFQGPSIAVDTACSSSLVAVHLACQSLRNGEATLAVAAGVNLMLSPTTTRLVATTKALSPDGRCRTFDAGAGGFVRGEGGGVLVLKLLSDAQRDGDPILATIRGSAVNQDGRSTGLTTPNVLSQQAMLQQALTSARVSADDVGYIEVHGTGTSLGDPIEFEALRAVVGKPRADRSRCVLGAVKTNIGHLEAAAGIAGLIKSVMALQLETVPRNLHFRALNPRISLEGTPFTIPTENLPWRREKKPRVAGVSSFGLSGTNAHVILEEAPVDLRDDPPVQEASSYVLPLSAKSPEALRALAGAYAEMLTSTDGTRLHDIAYTASVRRMHHEHRLAVTGRTHEELSASLAAFASEGGSGDVTADRAASASRPKVVFVFPGQGSQWLGMGRRLLVEERVFRDAMEICDDAIRRLGGFSVLEELAASEATSRLHEINVVQPTLFAIEVALANLWRSWGVEPDAVVGHSMGEVAAARVAGILSLEDAVKVICRRSRLLRRVSGQGAMALVELDMALARQMLAGYEDRLSIAVSNGPQSTVLSGEPEALDEVLASLDTAGIFYRRVKVDVASHSPQMDPLREELLAALRNVHPRQARLPMRSTVTGETLRGTELDASYWVKNLREPVLFSAATQRLIDDGHTVFVEMSPHPILLPSVGENLQERKKEGVALASMRRNADERRTMLEALGVLYARGYPVDWKRLYPYGGRCVQLPTYAWQGERHWVEGVPAMLAHAPPPDPVTDWVYEVRWQRKDPSPAPSAPATARGAWLLFEDRGGLGAELAARLTSRGEAVVRVAAGERFARPASDRYEIDLASPGDYEAVLQAAFDGGRPCHGVVHLAGLDATPWERATAETLEGDQRTGFLSALRAVQAIVRRTWRAPPRLWLVTRGVQAVGNAPVTGVAQAPLWGLGRTLMIEHPELRCALLDLDASGSPQAALDLLSELDASDAETQVVLRGGARYVARLCRSSFDAVPARAFQLEAEASYLVTGGLGGLGLAVARWLVDQGVRHLALVGRRPPTPEVRGEIAAMGAKGAEVLVLSADVSSRPDVERVLAEISRRMPRLRGIVHAAGVGGEKAMIPELEERTFWPLMAPKLFAAFHLLEATKGLPLDFFVSYSSASAALGLAGHASYAAANAALDAVAHGANHAGAHEQCAISIQWGPFSEAGLAAQDGVGERMGRSGLASMTPEQGSAAVGRLLARPRAEVAVMALSPRRWLDVFPQHSGTPFWSELEAGRPSARARAVEPVIERFRQTLSAAAPADRGGLLVGLVREQLGKILRLDPSAIEPGQSFHFYGFDSLMGLELRNKLQTSLEISLSMADIITHARIDALAELLAQRLAPVLETPGQEESAHSPPETHSPPQASEPSRPGSWVVVPRPVPGARMRLICFPYAGGSASLFGTWPGGLPPEIEVCAIQPPGRHERLHEPLPRSVEEMVAALIPELLPYLDRPFATFGHCLGAIVMFEALRELAARHGLKPAHVFAAAAPVPSKYAVPNVKMRSPQEFADLLSFIGFTRSGVFGDADAERHLLPAVLGDFEVAARYRYVPSAPLDVSLTVLSGREDTFAPPHVVDEWLGETTSWSSKIVLPGEHYFIVPERAAVLSILGAELTLRLAAIEQRAANALPAAGGAVASPEPGDRARRWVRSPAPRPSPRVRLFCFPGVGQSTSVYARWPSLLGDDVEVCMIDLPGRGARAHELPLGRVDEIVDHVEQALEGRLDLPYAFFGIDVGAILMFEVTRRLRRARRPLPSQLFVLAAMAPQEYFWAPMHHMPRERLFHGLRTLGFSVDPSELTELALRAECATMASYTFEAEPRLDIPVTAFWGERDLISPAGSVRSWQQQTAAAFTFHVWPGSHNLVSDEVSVVLDVVRETLGKAPFR
jgi:acyl transferase domain-containing protein/surfactin synthase thioesterase subunit